MWPVVRALTGNEGINAEPAITDSYGYMQQTTFQKSISEASDDASDKDDGEINDAA
jgi:hypothetical protein